MATEYCTRTDVENRLSALGVTLRLEDYAVAGGVISAGDEAIIIAAVIDDASSVIDEYCWGRYSETALSASRWATQRATDIAVMFLCERRGNPAPSGIAEKYQAAMQSLDRVQKGQLMIPATPMRQAAAPQMSNIRVVMRPFPRSVVERFRSTGPTPSYVDNRDPYDAVAPVLDYAI